MVPQGDEILRAVLKRLEETAGVRTLTENLFSFGPREGASAIVAYNEPRVMPPGHKYEGCVRMANSHIVYDSFSLLEMPSGVWVVSSGKVEDPHEGTGVRDLLALNLDMCLVHASEVIDDWRELSDKSLGRYIGLSVSLMSPFYTHSLFVANLEGHVTIPVNGVYSRSTIRALSSMGIGVLEPTEASLGPAQSRVDTSFYRGDIVDALVNATNAAFDEHNPLLDVEVSNEVFETQSRYGSHARSGQAEPQNLEIAETAQRVLRVKPVSQPVQPTN